MWCEAFLAGFALVRGKGLQLPSSCCTQQAPGCFYYSKCRVGIPARFWLFVDLQLIFSQSFVIFFLSKTLCTYLKSQDFIFILPCTLIYLLHLFLSSHVHSVIWLSYSEIHAEQKARLKSAAKCIQPKKWPLTPGQVTKAVTLTLLRSREREDHTHPTQHWALSP